MIDITHKHTTLREATAQAIVKVGALSTIEAIKNNTVPKGNVLEMAKTAGLFAVKKTAEMIPDCHPLPIESTKVEYHFDKLEIIISVIVKTIYKTGVEVEAMHGASVVALTIYDMLKPLDKKIEISSIKLNSKKGGKSDFKDTLRRPLKAAVVICSDSISKGKKPNTTGEKIIEKLKLHSIEIAEHVSISVNATQIKELLQKHCKLNTNLLIYAGGTGLSHKDVTPDTLSLLLDREVPGIVEASRNYGQDRTPYAMLSRGICGIKENTLVLAIPGSLKGASESIDAIFPSILHIFKTLKAFNN